MKKKKVKYKGIRNYPIRIEGKLVRPGDVIEITEAEFSKLDTWHFEILETATTTNTDIDYELEEIEGKTKKKKEVKAHD